MRLDKTGWAIVWGARTHVHVRQALEPLLRYRKSKAGDLYREFDLHPGETAFDFLLRHGVVPGATCLRKVPYYLLLVGDVDDISFDFQCQLGLHYGVGRLFFESTDPYASYANKVLLSEKIESTKTLAFFVPAHPNDAVARMHLRAITRFEELVTASFSSWKLIRLDNSRATKVALIELLTGSERVALLYVLAHGAVSGNKDLEVSKQGGVLCAEFYERNWHGRADDMSSAVMFSSEDISAMGATNARVVFLDVCDSVGTTTIGANGMLACLPSGLLGADGYGPLAVIGHVDKPSTLTFFMNGLWTAQTYEATFSRLLHGHRVGFAVKRHAQRSADIFSGLRHIDVGGESASAHSVASEELLELATMERNILILGDPATRAVGSQE